MFFMRRTSSLPRAVVRRTTPGRGPARFQPPAGGVACAIAARNSTAFSTLYYSWRARLRPGSRDAAYQPTCSMSADVLDISGIKPTRGRESAEDISGIKHGSGRYGQGGVSGDDGGGGACRVTRVPAEEAV